MVGHSRDGEWKVALDEDCRPPPPRPGGVSFGVRPEFWGADGVEFGGGGVSGVLEDEGVWLGLLSEGVVVDICW